MSAGLIQRLEAIFEPVWHHHNPFFRKDCVMTALTRLAAAVGDLTAENKDLKQQLADAKAKPAGTADTDLDGITSQIEAALGHAVADPGTSSTGTNVSQATADTTSGQPVVGDASTTVTAADGSVTTVAHHNGEASTVDASGASAATDEAAAQAATEAAQAAGKMMPSA